MAKKKNLASNRNAIAKRLKRRGIIQNQKNISTEELEALWEKYKDAPVVKPVQPVPQANNYQIVVNILERFTVEYKDYFIGKFRDAWKYVSQIEYFYQRLDKDKMNNDLNFVPIDIKISDIPPSDWAVNDQFNLEPIEIPEYIESLYSNYLR